MSFSFCLLLVFLLLAFSSCFIFFTSVSNGSFLSLFNGFFMFDSCSLYLGLICFFFIIYFGYYIKANLVSFSLLFLSLITAIFCFYSSDLLLFWVCYELSILFLLALIYMDSPYSDRFLGGWYLWGYMLLTGLPMLLCFIGIILSDGSLSIFINNLNEGAYGLILALLFATKVPLPPFSGWLPIVHAEASTQVSIMLSGYIMKLGMVGLYRFCGSVFVSFDILISFLFLFSLLFFFSAFVELDMKRWLAYLSLSHILIPLLAFGFFTNGDVSVSFFYCLGHGFSAGLLFYIFSLLSSNTGSRNWIIASYNSGSGLLYSFILLLGLLSVASFPPSLSFFSEVLIIKGILVSIFVLLVFFVYVFFAGLVPLWVFGSLVNNNMYRGFGHNILVKPVLLITFLFFWWWIGSFCL